MKEKEERTKKEDACEKTVFRKRAENLVRKTWNKKWMILGIVFGLCSLYLGIFGFWLKEGKISDTVYNTLQLYFVAYNGEIANVLIDIARFLALIFAVFVLSFVVSELKKGTRGWKYLFFRKRRVYIYGDTEIARRLYNDIMDHGKPIKLEPIYGMGEEFIHAKEYYLLGNEAENLKFYCDHQKKLQKKRVYISCDSISRVMLGEHTFFSVNQIVARRYWREQHLLEEAFEWKTDTGTPEKRILDFEKPKPCLRLAIIGFNSFGEELLYQALQTNIFSERQRVEYHIYGDVEEFGATHKNCREINVTVHGEPWYGDIENLKSMDRILISDVENSIFILQKILMEIATVRVDAFTNYISEYQEDFNDLMRNHRYGKLACPVNLFPYLDFVSIQEDIRNDYIIDVAKELNMGWTRQYDENLEETPEERDAQWEALTAEKRYSNFAAADYHVIRKAYLEARYGETWREEWKTAASMDELSRLEHIRWVNYYWFYNWEYNEDLKKTYDAGRGGSKNADRKYHICLVPYDELNPEFKVNDALMIAILMENELYREFAGKRNKALAHKKVYTVNSLEQYFGSGRGEIYQMDAGDESSETNTVSTNNAKKYIRAVFADGLFYIGENSGVRECGPGVAVWKSADAGEEAENIWFQEESDKDFEIDGVRVAELKKMNGR